MAENVQEVKTDLYVKIDKLRKIVNALRDRAPGTWELGMREGQMLSYEYLLRRLNKEEYNGHS